MSLVVQFCPFVQRTWITLEEKGIPYQYNEVNPYKKEKHFLGVYIHVKIDSNSLALIQR